MPMSEARFSANFRLPNQQGVETQFTVRSDVSPQALISELGTLQALLASHGYGHQAGDTERVLNIDAIAVGTFKDSREQKYRKCLYLYSPQGKYKQATVYPEKIADMPRWVLDVVNDAKASPLPQAPERQVAHDTGSLIVLPRQFKVVKAMRVDADNNPLLTPEGKKQYRVDRFIDIEGAPAPVVAVTNGSDHSSDVPF